MSKLGQISLGDSLIFEPGGPLTFPRVEIQRIDDYQPGVSKLLHYEIETFAASGDEPEATELERGAI